MGRLLNPTDIDLNEAENRYGFANVKSKSYILLELPIFRSGLYIAKAIEADSLANDEQDTVWLGWNCMDDFDEGKEPSEILTQIQ